MTVVMHYTFTWHPAMPIYEIDAVMFQYGAKVRLRYHQLPLTIELNPALPRLVLALPYGA
jgi:hypothetical protein